MGYKLYDLEDNEVTGENEKLQEKSIWHDKGNEKEKVFVKKYGKELKVRMNPQKVTDPTVPDLEQNKVDYTILADLKCQNTPIFRAKKYYGIDDPTYAVTFNLKDAFNYGSYGNNYTNLKSISGCIGLL
ncbi:hypothetical protein [Natranaerofaba carboxydovora]|uniref:hypothetical protein n=1 Tax=Natranaerofaba carboxydovora TaxID=2742683 RepID=UPI001F1388E8|nr:hypothetical protein [Natranaerofaba carboxydovora]UMZ73115.1 hypothetical protein ACONDI_00666 [Natranaerofaba carboxydovora]